MPRAVASPYSTQPPPPKVPELLARIAGLEQQVRELTDTLALRDKAARDAWAFARALMTRPTRMHP